MFLLKGVKDVARAAERVAPRFEILETAHRSDRGDRFRLEPGDDSERSPRVASRLCYAPRPLNLKDAAVEDHHFAVQVGERAQTKISVSEDRLDAYLAIVDARDECAGS